MSGPLHIREFRTDLLRAREKTYILRQNIPDSEIDILDLTIPTRFQQIEQEIRTHLKLPIKRKRSTKKDSSLADISRLVNEISLKTISEYKQSKSGLHTFLQSYALKLNKADKLKKKFAPFERNVLNSSYSRPADSSNILPDDTLLVSIALFHPTKNKKVKEWLLHSSQSLLDLERQIDCLANKITYRIPAKDTHFTIEGVKITALDKKLDELKIRLNYPYTYTHRQYCTHTIIFTDLRLITVDDVSSAGSYPREIFCSPTKIRRCEVCTSRNANKLCMKDELLGDKVCYLCERCFVDLHYDESGYLLYSTKPYPYVHD